MNEKVWKSIASRNDTKLVRFHKTAQLQKRSHANPLLGGYPVYTSRLEFSFDGYTPPWKGGALLPPLSKGRGGGG
jgi:hypothetical protein